MVERLQDSEGSELRGWGTRIKNFSLSHEEAYRANFIKSKEIK